VYDGNGIKHEWTKGVLMSITLPDHKTMLTALMKKDSKFEGIFIAGVKTTGIFCRPTCTAKKPRPENVEFFPSVQDALFHGYRPCKICNPLELKGAIPNWLAPILDEISDDPLIRFRDRDLHARGVDPVRVRRWFNKHHGMTFQAYLRSLRLGEAFGRIKHGEKVTDTAFDSGYTSMSGFAESFKNTIGFSPISSSKNSPIMITRILTQLGPMLAGATDEGVCLLEFMDRRMLETQLKRLSKRLDAELIPGTHEHFNTLDKQIHEYFSGGRKKFDLPLQLSGTSFQEEVWAGLQTIPYGSTRSYKEQAENIGRPEAIRAVARANGDNRIAIIIPCHRVIGSNGKLVGYGGGLWRKQYLLDLEVSNCASNPNPI
jgi:AraC family transcriptional regulator of adaptative response/methylated-DNA-[protein]-cysteine methyltransferase